MPLPSTQQASGSSPAPPHDVVLRACKAEIEQLKDTLHEIPAREANSSGTFSDVLEKKFLAQVKKNKTLSVQLGTAQQQLAAAQRTLQLEQEKTKRLVAATTALATVTPASATAGRKGAGRKPRRKKTNGHLNGNMGAHNNSNDDSSDDGDEEDDGEGTANGDSASVAVQRVYAQLHHKEIALTELQRENAALRSVLQREIGLRDDAGEVDALLKRTAPQAPPPPPSSSSTSAAAAGSSGASKNSNNNANSSSSPLVSSAATTGWRGRAEEIVLLRSRLKDAQRQVEALTAAAAESVGDDNDDASALGGVSSSHTPLGLPASVRAYLNMDGLPGSERRSVVSTTTTTTTNAAARRRDVDDDARDRLSAMQQQRAAQQRQYQVEAEKLQQLLADEKKKNAGLQARVSNMKADLDTLRAYVDTILDKSTTDDELVEAYKAELKAAQAEAREWQQKAAATATAAASSSSCDARGDGIAPPATLKSMRDGSDMTAAAARSAPYRKPGSSSPSTEPTSGGALTGSAVDLQRIDGVVYEWVLRACGESTALTKGRTHAPDPSTAPAATANTLAGAPAHDAIAAVLRGALRHAAEVERQVSSAHGSAAAAAASSEVEAAVLAENAALKRRIKALTEMMDREMQAQRVLWNAHTSPASAS